MFILCVCATVCGEQNLEKNYRDFQFRVTHLDPVIEPETYQRERSMTAAQMHREPSRAAAVTQKEPSRAAGQIHREPMRAAAQMHTEPMSSLGNCLCC